MQSAEKKITYELIEQDAINSEILLPDYKLALWIFLCNNKENCKALGRELRVKRYSNPGNVHYAILARLIGHIDNSYSDTKALQR